MSNVLSDFCYFLSGANEIVNNNLVQGVDYNIYKSNLYIQLSSQKWSNINGFIAGVSGLGMIDILPLSATLQKINIDGSKHPNLTPQKFYYTARFAGLSAYRWGSSFFYNNNLYSATFKDSTFLQRAFFSTNTVTSAFFVNNPVLSGFGYSSGTSLSCVSGITLLNNQNTDKFSVGSLLEKLNAETKYSTGEITIIPYEETPKSITAINQLTGVKTWSFSFYYPRLTWKAVTSIAEPEFLLQEDGGYLMLYP